MHHIEIPPSFVECNIFIWATLPGCGLLHQQGGECISEHVQSSSELEPNEIKSWVPQVNGAGCGKSLGFIAHSGLDRLRGERCSQFPRLYMSQVCAAFV